MINNFILAFKWFVNKMCMPGARRHVMYISKPWYKFLKFLLHLISTIWIDFHYWTKRCISNEGLA